MSVTVRSHLENSIAGFAESIPMGDSYPPDQGELQTFSGKTEDELTINRNLVGTAENAGWSTQIKLLGNFAVSPPEIDTVAYSHVMEGAVTEEFEKPIRELKLLELARVTIQMRSATNRLQHVQSRR